MRDWWSALHFLRPQWLWMLAAVPVIFLLHRVRDDVKARWSRYIEPALLDHLIVAHKKPWRFRPIHMACLLIALGAVAAAGPAWTREHPPFTEDKAPLVIALDLSPTMDAIDIAPSRLERARLKLRDLLKVRNGGRTALFVYAGTAHMVLPFTTDFSLFDLYLSSLSTSLMPDRTKDSAAALRAIEDFLKTSPAGHHPVCHRWNRTAVGSRISAIRRQERKSQRAACAGRWNVSGRSGAHRRESISD